jgi:hypothetical protein
MNRLGGLGKRLSLTFLTAGATFAALIVSTAFAPARAQQLAGANRNANGFDLKQAGASLPPTPPQGAWGEVIMANSKWLVVQNNKGQQFPIAMDQVRQFLIRWPITPGDLTTHSMVEAIGNDVGSNTFQTDHVDVFEGADQTLVQPTYANLLPDVPLVVTVDPGFNRFMNGIDTGATLMNGWAYPPNPSLFGIATRVHVVGNVLDNNPVRVSILATNFVTLVPDPTGFSITQITRGDPDFAEKGDVVFLMPTDMTPRSVALSQLILYKKVARKDWRRPK